MPEPQSAFACAPAAPAFTDADAPCPWCLALDVLPPPRRQAFLAERGLRFIARRAGALPGPTRQPAPDAEAQIDALAWRMVLHFTPLAKKTARLLESPALPAADLAQEALLIVYRAALTHDPQTGCFRARAAFLVRHGLARLARHVPPRGAELATDPSAPEPPAPDDRLDVARLLSLLPPGQDMALRLRFLKLGASVRAARQQVQEALDALRAALNKTAQPPCGELDRAEPGAMEYGRPGGDQHRPAGRDQTRVETTDADSETEATL